MRVYLRRTAHPSARMIFLGAAIAVSLVLALVASAQQPKPAVPGDKPAGPKSSASIKPKGKLAEDVYKNIKSLKGQPATQLIPTMQFISASLGVSCEFCHDTKAFDKDTKDEKQTAREMIAMQQSINRENFKGKREVTCNSCHHGEQHPASIPALPELTAAIPEPEHEHGAHKPPQVAAPTEYLDAFIRAAGGEAALAKLTSRSERGAVSFGNAPLARFESYTRSSGQRATAIALEQGAASSTFDGHTGWLVYPGRHPREMSAGELEAAHIEADFEFPVNFKQRYTEFRGAHPETINGQQSNVLLAIRPGQPPVRLYFDATSKLLIRVIYYIETPLGRIPTQIDITSYAVARNLTGVQLPTQWTVTLPASRATYTVESSEINTPIDDSRFAPPAPAEAAAH